MSLAAPSIPSIPGFSNVLQSKWPPIDTSKPATVAAAGAAGTNPAQPTQQTSFGPVNARQENRIGAQNISVSYLPDVGMAVFVVALVLLVAGIVWLVWA